MAHSISAKKRVRQSETRQLRNKSYKTMVKNLEKKVQSAISSGNKEESLNAFLDFQKKIDSVARKGILHKKLAARKKNRIMKQINAL